MLLGWQAYIGTLKWYETNSVKNTIFRTEGPREAIFKLALPGTKAPADEIRLEIAAKKITRAIT